MNENPIILVYYKFRGQLQPIRNLLCYLELPFFEVHIQSMEQERQNWPNAIKEKLKGAKIDKNRLPTLIYESYTVYQPYPILSFICHRFEREDLLGTNPQERARLQEILQAYFAKQPQSMNQLWQLSDKANSMGKQEMQIILCKSYENIMNRSRYVRQICEHLDLQLNPRYILSSQITIVDFLFLQTCNYILGLCNNCDKYQSYPKDPIKYQDQLQYNEQIQRMGKKANVQYLKVMRDFKQRMEKHQFYQKHCDYLESFSIISYMTTQERATGLRKLWQLKDFFVK